MSTTLTFRLTNCSDRPLVFALPHGITGTVLVPPAGEGATGSVNMVLFGAEDGSSIDSLFEASFKAAIAAGELVVESVSTFRLKSTSARGLTLSERFSVPSASEAPNGVEICLNQAERNIFERALATMTDRGRIAAGEFVLEEIAPEPQSPISA